MKWNNTENSLSLLFFYYRRLGKGQGENHHRQSYRRPPAPEIQPVDRRVLTVEEMEIFLKEIFLERLRVAMFLSLFTGARMGEILSLEWGDLNEKKRSIRINKDLERVQLFDDPSGKKTELIVPGNHEKQKQQSGCPYLRKHLEATNVPPAGSDSREATQSHEPAFPI